MSESKWSDGPWKADGHHVRTSDAGIGAPYIIAKGRNAKANARLIAAAPDLYTALIETLEIATRNEEGEFADRARSALAKAAAA